MPFINVKYVKKQVNQEQKDSLIDGLMDIIVNIMGRNPNTTVITIDETDQSNWIIGGKSVDKASHDKVLSVEIRISKGTSTAEQMASVIKAGKELVKQVLGSSDATNYFIITELNPDSWGFDGISMSVRNAMEQKMSSINFSIVNPSNDLSAIVQVLNTSHGTVAQEFCFTKISNPTNNAFIDESALRIQLNKGIDLYAMSTDGKLTGCIAIEKSKKEMDTFYIEKVSILPDFRNQGFGVKLMDFALSKIKGLGGKQVSITLIDSNAKLKNWYSSQGFKETMVKDFDHLPFRVCFMIKQL